MSQEPEAQDEQESLQEWTALKQHLTMSTTCLLHLQTTGQQHFTRDY